MVFDELSLDSLKVVVGQMLSCGCNHLGGRTDGKQLWARININGNGYRIQQVSKVITRADILPSGIIKLDLATWEQANGRGKGDSRGPMPLLIWA